MTEKEKEKEKKRVFNYNVNWENEPWAQGWLMKAVFTSKEQNQAHCKVCYKSLRAHPADLKKHGSKPTHLKEMSNIDAAKQKSLETLCNVSYKKQEKSRDLIIATFVACHTSIRAMDHLNDVLKSSTPALKDMQMHRTKCSNLITNVIAPNLLKELIEDI
ncbi:uncharacterized protein LOC107981553 isoform X1 [Nasonia vitripennis]|uniref:Uncharacterized protein n=2 Tax=Nasonia vitripennis TaxID=7425 RepID=A0A7M7IT10_NASVI|nr:uncharacterized protein LOC107981553 isoform X1 [Nasonia vitripennis]